MKKLLVLIILVIGGYVAYDHYLAPRTSAAYRAYEVFADRLDAGDYAAAAALVPPGSSAASAVRNRKGWQEMYRLEVTQAVRTITAESQTGTRAVFTIVQRTFTSPGPTPPALPDFQMTQSLVLVNGPDGWVLDTFRETIDELALR